MLFKEEWTFVMKELTTYVHSNLYGKKENQSSIDYQGYLNKIKVVTDAYPHQICLVLSSLFSFAHSFHNLCRYRISYSVRFLCIISFGFRSF